MESKHLYTWPKINWETGVFSRWSAVTSTHLVGLDLNMYFSLSLNLTTIFEGQPLKTWPFPKGSCGFQVYILW